MYGKKRFTEKPRADTGKNLRAKARTGEKQGSEAYGYAARGGGKRGYGGARNKRGVEPSSSSSPSSSFARDTAKSVLRPTRRRETERVTRGKRKRARRGRWAGRKKAEENGGNRGTGERAARAQSISGPEDVHIGERFAELLPGSAAYRVALCRWGWGRGWGWSASTE